MFSDEVVRCNHVYYTFSVNDTKHGFDCIHPQPMVVHKLDITHSLWSYTNWTSPTAYGRTQTGHHPQPMVVHKLDITHSLWSYTNWTSPTAYGRTQTGHHPQPMVVHKLDIDKSLIKTTFHSTHHLGKGTMFTSRRCHGHS